MDSHLGVIRHNALPDEGRAGLTISTLYALFYETTADYLTLPHRVDITNRQSFVATFHGHLRRAETDEPLFDPWNRYIDYATETAGIRRSTSGKVKRRVLVPDPHHRQRRSFGHARAICPWSLRRPEAAVPCLLASCPVPLRLPVLTPPGCLCAVCFSQISEFLDDKKVAYRNIAAYGIGPTKKVVVEMSSTARHLERKAYQRRADPCLLPRPRHRPAPVLAHFR